MLTTKRLYIVTRSGKGARSTLDFKIELLLCTQRTQVRDTEEGWIMETNNGFKETR